ncbi:uncharacterized protein LOC111351242 [Spodoptera litura]|uniref:Uncharacterized protein LOC111351242 n=1 Tax=Spodoptera litura TaxID=69820 RepID=A0A9J7DZD8_SPOLT|nr:uncharacterized protein LOC111351242 [Spodoptera litura]
MSIYYLFLLIFFIHVGCVLSELSLRFVFIIEAQEQDLTRDIGRALKLSETVRPEVKLDDAIVLLDRENEEESSRILCSAVSKGVSMVIDLSWSPWQTAEDLASEAGIPLVRTLLGSQQLVKALDSYLESRNATDAALILESESDVDRTLYELLGASNIRVWVHAGLTRDSAKSLKTMRPEPSFYIIVGENGFVMDTYRRAVKEKLVRRNYRWNLILTDYSSVEVGQLVLPTVILQSDPVECCKLLRKDECNCPSDFQRKQYIINSLILYLSETYSKLEGDLPFTTSSILCEEPQSSMNVTRDRLFRQFAEDSEISNETLFFWDGDRSGLFLRSRFVLSIYKPEDGQQVIATWSADENYKLLPGIELEPLRMFFRIGTAPAVPWTLMKLDPKTGEQMYNEDGQPLYEGYCIDLIARLSETMSFDYEIVSPKTGDFGKKLPNGTWDGVVGDLMRGETDIAISALTMTAEREEVIDFVAPYFEQTGILIVIRKPIRKTSLFKFMTVLRTEVWLSIVAALVLTGFMIWLLDKYSPYSARNNPDAYPYPCREFTLKESFWFALTSFTPQGGGEAPKALSGRTLVAAYWLFVVLMLATFTANLAAFLTVERMQTPVSSLEQLARQSRINYTVVEGSSVHQYFVNMKFAEDTLYRVWKEITLNATSDQAQYRVWDYPIREQYGHILLAINASRK